ncbi:hypothetical protein [Sphingobium sp. DC-2]|uniref:hypothetical protein n=1 Tax=Sphingobium sp. DC-2 TaxID=1303256 RepID=UPI0012DEB2F6|nr:hypothetical protein [Sphingobium sp. DC-2]
MGSNPVGCAIFIKEIQAHKCKKLASSVISVCRSVTTFYLSFPSFSATYRRFHGTRMAHEMAVNRDYPEAVIDLDRKVSRALQQGRGITLSPSQLDVLASIGMIGRLAEEKARILSEQARERQEQRRARDPNKTNSRHARARARQLFE